MTLCSGLLDRCDPAAIGNHRFADRLTGPFMTCDRVNAVGRALHPPHAPPVDNPVATG